MTHDRQKLDEISQCIRKWQTETVLRSFDKLERGEFSTASRILVSRVYSPIEVADVHYLYDMGFPRVSFQHALQRYFSSEMCVLYD